MAKRCNCGFGWSETTRRAQKQHAASLKVGDRVRYSRNFLRSTGQYTGDVPFAKGRIVGFEVLGPVSDPDVTKLAEIDWENCDCPPRVNVYNLSRVGRPEPE
jgi:hypothetical protein